jgi:hypothetical protein
MAYITVVSGGSQPVFALDTLNGPLPQSTSLAGNSVQPQGPKLDFYRFVAANTMNTQGEVNGFVANVLQALQQTTTVAMYQVDGTALSVAIYPTGSFANTTVATAVANTAGVVGVNQINSSTNAGFKLST